MTRLQLEQDIRRAKERLEMASDRVPEETRRWWRKEYELLVCRLNDMMPEHRNEPCLGQEWVFQFREYGALSALSITLSLLWPHPFMCVILILGLGYMLYGKIRLTLPTQWFPICFERGFRVVSG